MTTQLKSNRTSVVLTAALLLGSAVAAGAQNTQLASSDARWTPWVGCWQASSRDAETQALAPNKSLPVVCIVPTGGTKSVDLVTVTGGTATPERVDANGTRREISREGCNGWETAEFSPDAKRIYLRSEHLCSGNRTRTSNGIMSISPNGEWLDVEGVKVESHSGVRVVHYGRVPTPAALSADMKAAVEGLGLAQNTAVLAASDSVRIADVIEATKHVDPLVVQTWLAQRGQGFAIDAKRLTQLADAKVPANVIDVMIALSYPQDFAVNLAQADGQVIPTGRTQANAQEALRDGPTVYMNWDPLYSDSYGYYSRYGYRGGLGYSGFYPGYWYQGTPVVITRPSGTVDVPDSDTRGRMVKGRGYTRPSSDGSSSTGSPRSSTSGGSSSSGGSTSTSSGGSSSGGETRTARPKSP
jgi:uncharacterized membrane protein YgcG